MGKEKVNYGKIIEKAEMELFFDNLKNGNYEPLDGQKNGVTYINFFGYKGIKNSQLPKDGITSDFLVDFIEVTGKRLGIHPAYLLSVLKQEFQDVINYWIEENSAKTRNKGGSMDYCINRDIIEEDILILQKMPEAMKKLLSKNPSYIS
jgi:hypothetical protein